MGWFLCIMMFKKMLEKLQHFLLLNYIINFISNFTVEMLMIYIVHWYTKGFVSHN